jgi:hypothetical protein
MRPGDVKRLYLRPGDEAPETYVRDRLEIERQHDERARLGTFKKPAKNSPKNSQCPVEDSDSVYELQPWGIRLSLLEAMDAAGCHTVGELRASLSVGEIREWTNCRDGAERQARTALRKLDAAKRRASDGRE